MSKIVPNINPDNLGLYVSINELFPFEEYVDKNPHPDKEKISPELPIITRDGRIAFLLAVTDSSYPLSVFIPGETSVVDDTRSEYGNRIRAASKPEDVRNIPYSDWKKVLLEAHLWDGEVLS